MQLVCKAWRDACSDHLGSANLLIKHCTDLSALSKLLPSLSQLRVISPNVSFAAYSLSAFSRLNTLKMRMGRKEEYREIQMQELDMSVFPPSITVLELMGFEIDPLGFSSTKCLGIKSLTITWAGNTAEEIVALLQQLPLLQASLLCARRIELV